MSQAHTTLARGGSEPSEWRRGGRTAVAAALGYGAGPVLFLTTASLFVKPTMEATGWSTREVLISPWLSGLFALFGPVVSVALNKKGVRPTAAFGLIGFAALLVVFAVMPLNHLTYYSVAALIGLVGSFAFGVTFNRAVAGWFHKSAGKAFGLVGAGGAAMPFIAIPVISYVIYTFGWRTGYVAIGAFAIAIALPAVLFGIQNAPADNEAVRATKAGSEAGHRSGSSGHTSPMRTARFWVFVGAVTISVGGANAFLANAQPILLDGGLSLVAATSITTLFSVGVITGRLGAGALLDLANKYAVAVGVFTISAIGALALTNVQTLSIAVVAAAALMVAFSQGAEGDIAAYFILDEYGRRDFARLFAFAMAVTAVAGIGIPFAFASIVDATGSYFGACILGASCYLLGAALLLIFRAMGPKRAAVPAHRHGPASNSATTVEPLAVSVPTVTAEIK